MPYVSNWVNPKLFLTHKGVKVYHTYKNDDCQNNPPSENHFTTDRDDGSYEGKNFDVRKLPTWVEPAHPPFLCGKDDTAKNKRGWDQYFKDQAYLKAARAAIKAAIDSGHKLDSEIEA